MKLPRRNKIDKNKKIKFTKKYKQSSNQFKPRGFWYSCHDSWYNWIIEEGMKKILYKYIHKVNINNNVMTSIGKKDKNKLLIIKSIKDFDIFNKKYGTEYKKKMIFNDGDNSSNSINFYKIDWIKVSKDYGGIEICPFLQKRKGYIWYCGWDVASGYIWNTEAIIKNTELIYEKKNKEYIRKDK
tara:strand:+ start:67 stop:618 length:552 start_codon:yes stop_codon:yes gene_type:complete